MSDDLLSTSEEEDGSRRRAVWGLLVLALIATIFVAIMVFVLGTSSGLKSNQPEAGTGPTSAGSASQPAPPPRSPTSAPPSSGTQSPSPAVNTAHPCPSSAACIVDGDVGGLVQAINTLRARNGLPAVPGTVSPKAQQCAVQQGSGSSCQPHFAWQPVPTPNGTLVVTKIGAQWLLDRGMTSFSVGWAYVPNGPTATGQWECAVIKFP